MLSEVPQRATCTMSGRWAGQLKVHSHHAAGGAAGAKLIAFGDWQIAAVAVKMLIAPAYVPW